MALAAFGIIYLDLQPEFCLNKACLENFVAIYQLPINLITIAIILGTLSLAYYRAKLTFEQNERQYKQDVLTNCKFMKDALKDLLKETERYHEFNILQLNPEVLFSELYPNSLQGDFSVSPEIINHLIEEIIFFHDCIKKTVSTVNIEAYYTPEYSRIYQIYENTANDIALSHRKNFEETNAFFLYNCQDNLNLIHLIEDLTELSKLINTLNGWKWFSYADALVWTETITKIKSIMAIADLQRNRVQNFLTHEKYLIAWFSQGESNRYIQELREFAELPYIEKQVMFEIFAATDKDSELTSKYLGKIQETLKIEKAYEHSTHLKILLTT